MDLLRRQASSWIIKVVLGLIVLSFAFFFGYTEFQSQAIQAQRAIAMVDETPISRLRYQTILQEYLSRLRESPEQEIPENAESILGGQLLDQLVTQELSYQFARSLGIRIPDEEIAENIRKHPALVQEGSFDETYYHQTYRPSFKNRYGEEFEEAVRKEMTVESLTRLSTLCFGPWMKELTPSLAEGISLSPETLTSRWIDRFRDEIDIKIYQSPF